ncbi:MAG: DUF2057 domain-containing protein [Alcanivorax sp.]|nr:DUF2057 domain-containing protein [Alcanivorax sp.]
MRHWLRSATLILLALLLAACERSPVVRLYDGPQRPDSEVAVVRVPETLEILNINGQRPAGVNTLFSSGYKDLHLAPGEYQIVAFYKEIWEPDTTSSHVVVRSEPVVFDVEGRPGSFFRLGYDAPETLPAARELARNFSGWSEHIASGERRPTRPSGMTRPGLIGGLASGATQPEAQAIPPAQTTPAPATANEDVETLDMLKAWWSQASAEERRAFLRWVAE